MKFTLIRHAKTKVDPAVPITLWGLTEDGAEKAKKLSESKEIKKLEITYASTQTKAIEALRRFEGVLVAVIDWDTKKFTKLWGETQW